MSGERFRICTLGDFFFQIEWPVKQFKVKKKSFSHPPSGLVGRDFCFHISYFSLKGGGGGLKSITKKNPSFNPSLAVRRKQFFVQGWPKDNSSFIIHLNEYLVESFSMKIEIHSDRQRDI